MLHYEIVDDNIHTRCTILVITSEKGTIQLFSKLFPAYSELINKIHIIIDKVINRLVEYYASPDKKPIKGAISSYFIKQINDDYGLGNMSSNKLVLEPSIREIMKTKMMVGYIVKIINSMLSKKT